MTDGWLVAVVETSNVTVSPQFGTPFPFASETMTRLRLEGSLPPPLPQPLPAAAVEARARASAAIETTKMLRRRFMRLPFLDGNSAWAYATGHRRFRPAAGRSATKALPRRPASRPLCGSVGEVLGRTPFRVDS